MRAKLEDLKWISVKDSLPDFYDYVLLHHISGVVSIGYLYYQFGKLGFINEDDRGLVTHWMPLPEAPKGYGQ